MLSKTAEYALRAVTFLAGRPGQPASAVVLAEHTQVPRSYLHRVLQDLASGGLVRSRPGPGGGYELVGEASRITIFDVVTAVAPLERIRSCPLGLKSHVELCPLHRELDRAYAATEEAFRGVTIQAILDSADPIIPLWDTPESAG